MTGRGWPKVACLDWATALGLREDLEVTIPVPANKQGWLGEPKPPIGFFSASEPARELNWGAVRRGPGGGAGLPDAKIT